MLVNGQQHRSIWHDANTNSVKIIDQTALPHQFRILSLDTLTAAAHAIRHMQVRGAPLIGVTAAYGVYLALRDDSRSLDRAISTLAATRPTAVNLAWALTRVEKQLATIDAPQRAAVALQLANAMADEDVAVCEAIGRHGAQLLESLWRKKAAPRQPLQILTHCNAGWLATVDWGTALACVYQAQAAGIPVHVWVDETRPRNQGAALTTWELAQQGIAHTLIVDNTGGYLMQKQQVDVCLVGSDRTTVNGDVCNKIGTYLKALAAQDNNIPFYVALPVSTIDFSIADGLTEIPIEERDGGEVLHIGGRGADGQPATVALAAEGTPTRNYGFDITPARLVSGLITEQGVCAAERSAILALRH